jgi:hypothetical protein
MGMTACAALMAASGIASAADVAAKGVYYAPGGLIVQSSCGAISPTLAVGVTSDAVFFYPGAGGSNFDIDSPAVSPATKTGGAAAYACLPGTLSVVKGVTKFTAMKVPLTGLNGASMPYACYADTLAGPGDGGKPGTAGKTPVATATVSFNAAATSNPIPGAALDVETTETLNLGGGLTCTYVTDATWFAR